MNTPRPAGLESALLRAWQHRGWLAWLLWPLSLLYGFVARCRRALYRLRLLGSTRLRVPVVVVGNLVAGGAGKTPVTIALVRHLQSRGVLAGVVARGYGRTDETCREVLADSTPAEVGDEPLLVRRASGAAVFVARSRSEAAEALLAAYPGTQLIVCDDGLQHYALQRDIELCLFDDRGVGNGFLLPAGPLREPSSRKVDFVLHTGQRPAFAGGHAVPRVLAVEAVRADGSRRALRDFAGEPVLALAGIAQPESFFTMLRAQGVQPERTLALADHYDFDSWERPSGKRYSLICTEKDAVKLWRLHPDAWAVPLSVTLPDEFLRAFDARLDAKLSSRDGRQTA